MKARYPRMPAARQRRLNSLIARAKGAELSVKEETELQELLEDVDQKSFRLVRRLANLRRLKPPLRSTSTP
jgi:hypothetical protein